jgi:RNA polymerase sigma factor (sigma-70 family)
MNLQAEFVIQKIEESLKIIANRDVEEIAECIRPILFVNLQNGRVDSFTEGQAERIQEYVLRVADHYKQWHEYIDKVQIEKDDLVWEALLLQLRKWTYSFFIHYGFEPIYTRTELVPTQANEVAIQLLKAHFPFDTSFEPWAFNIVKSTCLKFMRTSMKKSAVPIRYLVDLDDSLENWIPDPQAQLDVIYNEEHSSLIDAINQLPPIRRKVIIQKYFYELPSSEIAENTKKSVSAVYSLHFNAIESLRKILID